MFTVFADQACTANIYTHKFNISMHAAEKQKTFQSAKVYPRNNNTCYTIFIYALYVTIIDCVLFLG